MAAEQEDVSQIIEEKPHQEEEAPQKSNAIITRDLISKSVNDFVSSIPHQVIESYTDKCEYHTLRNTICIARVLGSLNENHIVVVAYLHNNWVRLRVCLSGTSSWPTQNMELSRVSKNILDTKINFLRNEWFTLKIFGELPCLPDVIGSLYSQSGVDLSAYMLRQGLLLPYHHYHHSSSKHVPK
jgi:hypothetical protein